GECCVMPKAPNSVTTVYAESSFEAPEPEIHCEIRDTPVPPAPPCDTKFLNAPNPEDFYPVDSQKREEQGDVVLDFRIDSTTKKLRDIRVSRSSQYPALDLAGLEVGKRMAATTQCPDVRRQVKVKFRLTPDNPEPTPTPTPAN